MHEPELLPAWYPQLLRRRRTFVVQLRIAAALVLILGTQTLVAERRAEVTANKLLGANTHKINPINISARGDQVALAKYELLQHESIERQSGVRVPASRLLSVLDQMIVSPTALSELQMRTLEPGSNAAAQTHPATDPADQTSTDQPKMQIRLVGLAPSQEDLITLVTRLMAVPYFGEVDQGMQNVVDQQGRTLIHFELTFSLDLSNSTTANAN
jgi:hypothetical protein